MVDGDPIQRRLSNEWAIFDILASANSNVLIANHRRLEGATMVFAGELLQTTALVGEYGAFDLADRHAFELRFPRFFPSAPIEAWLRKPVFHPNVHPENGFVCLWSAFSSRHTCFDALTILQKVICWELVNTTPVHVMQPAAADWIAQGNPGWDLPLPYFPLRNPPDLALVRAAYARPVGQRMRPRLSTR